MVANIANSMGDTVVFDSNTPGGYRLFGHSTDANSLAKIRLGNWDYVVLQEQSQFPSFPEWQVVRDVYPYARKLDSTIKAHNPCAETMFYMTWGRKNGDASNCSNWPPVCTYRGMDSLLALRYTIMADSNNALLSPVGKVWRQLRNTAPLIELYQADESHPSVAGTFAAACTFYTALFRKDPTSIRFNSTLPAGDAATIKSAAKTVLYSNLLTYNIGKFDPKPSFSIALTSPTTISLTNTSQNATRYLWKFGDGNTSNGISPSYTYSQVGNYTVKLYAYSACKVDSFSQTVMVSDLKETLGYQNRQIQLFPNPTLGELSIVTSEALLGEDFVVCNALGKVVLTGTIKNTFAIISLKDLPNGFYYFECKGIEPIKVVKE